MPDARARATRRARPTRGFTLTELLVVMAIVGILIAFILIAAQDGVRRAQEKATQSLIQKLEAGVSERLEAILLRRADTSLGHHALAAVVNPNFPAINSPNDPNFLLVQAIGTGFLGSTNCIISPQRAQVIAQFDLVRAELPDVFFVQGGFGGRYPINFAGQDFPSGLGNYLIPLGAATTGTSPGQPTASSTAPGDPNQAVGIFGATWQAAAGIYKNLGYLPQGYDGADNNNDQFVDDFNEGIGTNPTVADPDSPSTTIQLSALITRRLAAHKHVTARSEMLYALLVEGVGPLGSVFNRDEFTNREVQDTDGDGLPEFVDAWGQPLQFYRWPIYYNNLSSTTSTGLGGGLGYVAKGSDLYNGPSEPRQIDPLDPNQSLVAPAWWSATVNGGSGTGASASAMTFMSLFHSLYEPNSSNPLPAGFAYWDRAGFYPRRAFYSRPLIVSGGPDQIPGVFLYTDAQLASLSTGTAIAQALIQVENQAAALDVSDRSGPLLSQVAAPSNYHQATFDLLSAGGDDITNQALASPTGGVR